MPSVRPVLRCGTERGLFLSGSTDCRPARTFAGFEVRWMRWIPLVARHAVQVGLPAAWRAWTDSMAGTGRIHGLAVTRVWVWSASCGGRRRLGDATSVASTVDEASSPSMSVWGNLCILAGDHYKVVPCITCMCCLA